MTSILFFKRCSRSLASARSACSSIVRSFTALNKESKAFVKAPPKHFPSPDFSTWLVTGTLQTLHSFSSVSLSRTSACKGVEDGAKDSVPSTMTLEPSRSPTVRLNSKLSKATLTSRTEKIRRPNRCSLTLKERSDSDDMVRQKGSKKQRNSLAGGAGMLTLLQSSRTRSVRPADRKCTATCVGRLRYSMATTRKVKELYSPRGAKKKVFLGTSSTVTLLEKNHARNVGQF